MIPSAAHIKPYLLQILSNNQIKKSQTMILNFALLSEEKNLVNKSYVFLCIEKNNKRFN